MRGHKVTTTWLPVIVSLIHAVFNLLAGKGFDDILRQNPVASRCNFSPFVPHFRVAQSLATSSGLVPVTQKPQSGFCSLQLGMVSSNHGSPSKVGNAGASAW
jgi:hypothetical protein